MGYWDLSTQRMPVRQIIPGVTPTMPGQPQQNPQMQFELYQRYFSPYNGGVSYDKKQFSQSIQEAKNQGLVLPKEVEKSMKELAKNELKWFTPEGYLQEGLSAKDAKNATKHRKIVNDYYERIRPKTREIQAKWAAQNFIKNGFDTTAAAQYANISNYNELVSLWGGDTAGAAKGNTYGAIAASNEKAFFDKLTAPQKRAYLNQRTEWIKSGLLTASGGLNFDNLQAVSDADMTKYMADHIQDWQNSFYGNNGYEDEYLLAHQSTLDENTANLYRLYGIKTPDLGLGTWTPAEAIRTSGFTRSVPVVTVSSASTGSKKGSRGKKGSGSGSGSGSSNASQAESGSSNTEKKQDNTVVAPPEEADKVAEYLGISKEDINIGSTWRGMTIQYGDGDGQTLVVRKRPDGSYVFRPTNSKDDSQDITFNKSK